ncbi:hypothetical protein [Rhodococcus artemisiae]|uniref:Uncharacterized protein n=1 Tax=Rhodococcus artemisiae TaxID=714159 RepID=A0ABU7LF99_9NOCA|nr:hypothetical protein [Rhodococcus artemisiae]MEE2060213.1 hypothetical protein [Rhodococcus artemisiae]
MICPHCSENLLRRERSDRTCSKCTRRFALEPKESPFALHDLRLQKLADRLSAGRGLYVTVTQLRYAAARRRLPSLNEGYWTIVGTWVALVLIPTYILSIIGGAALSMSKWWLIPLLGLLVVIVGLVVIYACRPLIRSRAHVRMQVGDEAFRDDVLNPWTAVYGGLPKGVVYESWVMLPEISAPRMVLLCADPSVRACLSANRVPEEHGMVLVADIDRVPPRLPVLILHDASIPGFAFARNARTMLGDRVHAVGLRPRSVMDDESAILLREPVSSHSAMQFLHDPLFPNEVEWLDDGWWSPIAAIPPARLLAAVSSAAERIEDDADPDRRFARQLGFLTWPTA